MIIEGSAVVVRESNVDTDALYPGSYLSILDPEEMKAHLFEGLHPSVARQIQENTILIVGHNFGTGSSREHVQLAMKARGIRCVIGESFSRIFYRNCVNLGIAVAPIPGILDLVAPGTTVRFDTTRGTVDMGDQRLIAPAVPPLISEIVDQGGLVPWVRSKLAVGDGPARR
jgi:3-isopropylmalate/(R)-2-methylmalate dehydratase small subunit